MDNNDEVPSPIADLIRDRPEAFDYSDVPDITANEESKRMQEDLLENAPPYMRALLGLPPKK